MSVQRTWARAALVVLPLIVACFDKEGRRSGGGTQAPEARSWTITASAGPGGTISPSGNVAVKAGERIRFSIAPDDAGFVVADVIVDGVSRGAIDAFEFEDVGCDHTIVVSFRPKGPCSVVLKLATQGTLPPGVQIGGIRVPVTYAAHKGLSIGAGDVVASGAATGAMLVANANDAGRVILGLITATGLPAAEFATLTFGISGGVTPAEQDFAVGAGATVIDVHGQPIPAVSVVIASQVSM